MGNIVLEHNTDEVYWYVGNNRDQHKPELQSVTYVDDNGAAHTIHAPKDLGLSDPHDIINAVERAHEAQQQFVRAQERDHGTLTELDREKANQVFTDTLTSGNRPRQGGDY